MREPFRSRSTTADRSQTNSARTSESDLSTWLRPRFVGLNGISGSESQICKCGEHLRAREHICGAGLRESALGSSYVQQAAYAVVV